MKPKNLLSTPISTSFETTNLRPEGPFLDSGRAIPAASRGGSLNIPTGFTNYYDDNNQTESQLRDTLMSHIGLNFTNTEPGGDFIEAHDHGEFDVEFDSSGLRPNSSIVCEVNLPATVNVDNSQNEKALQIDVNIAQPTLSCIYIIRAY